MVYIRQKDLPGLKKYKYSGVDHSLVSRYVLKPFYNNVVIGCFPMSMAPNAITLAGFSFVVLNILTMLWYNPTLDQDMPRWVYASWSLGLFLYQTFDAVDGTQAYVYLTAASCGVDMLIESLQEENTSKRTSGRVVRPWYE
ncbi:MAG: hypothetical protein Q9187_002758 [Circinaria calcarea]